MASIRICVAGENMEVVSFLPSWIALFERSSGNRVVARLTRDPVKAVIDRRPPLYPLQVPPSFVPLDRPWLVPFLLMPSSHPSLSQRTYPGLNLSKPRDMHTHTRKLCL